MLIIEKLLKFLSKIQQNLILQNQNYSKYLLWKIIDSSSKIKLNRKLIKKVNWKINFSKTNWIFWKKLIEKFHENKLKNCLNNWEKRKLSGINTKNNFQINNWLNSFCKLKNENKELKFL